MGLKFIWCGSVAILIALCIPANALDTSEDSLFFDIDQWEKYQDREDFSWSVDVLKPHLTLQQRFLVPVRANISGKRLPKSEEGHDLHFVMKVALEDGSWVPGYSYIHVPVSPQTDKSFWVNYVNGIYLRPGRYVIVLMVYDSISIKGNVLRKQVKVSPLEEDELPELDRNLKNVEFVVEAPQILRYGKAYAPLAEGREWLPVQNGRCLCVDIVTNLPLRYNQNNSQEFGRHFSNSINVLQVASVLSHLGLQNGHIRVSMLDALHVETVLDRENADNIDWRDTGRVVSRQEEVETIDYDTLRAQTEASSYLLDTLHKIMKEDSCTATEESPIKIVIFISGSMNFAERTPVLQFNPQGVQQNGIPVHYFYFRIQPPVGSDDDLDEMFIPEGLQIFTVKDPRSFRKILATFISQLEALER